MQVRALVCCLLVAIAGFGCSADAASHSGTAPGGGAASTAGTTQTNGGTTGGSFGNGNGNGNAGVSGMLQNMPGVDGGMGTLPGSVTPISIDACGAMNPAGISTMQVQTLMAGSGNPGAIKVLYPYEGTVFPRGMISPMLMWDGGGDFVYVHIKSKAFEYKGCLKPSMPGQIQIPQDVWDQAAARTYGPTDPYLFEVSTLTGSAATGPATFHIMIAQATIKGSIYYNSYSSKLPGVTIGGNVLRIPAGKPAEAFESRECNGCHSVSADGSRLLTQRGIGGGAGSAVLMSGGGPNPAIVADGTRGSFGAPYPDGSKYISNSGAVNVARSNITSSPADSILIDTNNGMTIPSMGIPANAIMPMFSPSGAFFAFAVPDSTNMKSGGISVMAFDNKTNAATGRRDLYKESDAAKMPAWPFFLPDDKGIVFLHTDSADFSGGAAGILGGGAGSIFALAGSAGTPFGELQLLDITSGKSTVLAQAMGYKTPADAASGTTYLPFGAEDLHHNYYPTVSPVAAGGFFWVFFDSYRHYGNMGLQRQLWGVAVDIAANGDYTVDRSHPPFYLQGQEFGTGNHRAFAALDPCKKQGDSCTSGIDCCGGFCYVPTPTSSEFKVEQKGTCDMPKVPTCSKTDEHCVTAADCCSPKDASQPKNSCIGGYCAVVVVQ